MEEHEVLESIRSEISGGVCDRMRLYSTLNAMSYECRKRILAQILLLLTQCIIDSEMGLSESYTHWKQVEQVFERLLSPINIQPGRKRRLSTLPLQKTIRKCFLELARKRKDAEISKIANEIGESIRNPQRSVKAVTNKIKVSMRLFLKIKEEKSMEREIVKVYMEKAEKHILKIKKLYMGEDLNRIEKKIKEIKNIPGIFSCVKGLTKNIKRQVKNSLCDRIISASLITSSDIFVLLEGSHVLLISEILQLNLPHEAKKKLLQTVQESIVKYSKKTNNIKYDSLVQICMFKWPEEAYKVVQKICRKVLIESVKACPIEYSSILVSKIRHFLRNRVENVRLEKKLLKSIADEVSNTLYFENALVLMLVNEMVRGASIKRARKILQFTQGTWKYQLKRRIDDLLGDFAEQQKISKRDTLIHANSFRWPNMLQKLNLNIPEISEMKKKIEKEKKKKKIKIEWIDTLSVVEIEINSESATLSLFQYWLILKVLKHKKVSVKDLADRLSTYKEHIKPFVHNNILELTEDGTSVIPGKNFNKESAWTDLLPEYAEKEKPVEENKKRTLLNLSIDSLITKDLKKVSPQIGTELLQKVAKMLEVPESIAEKRIESLINRGLIASETDSHNVTRLSYNP